MNVKNLFILALALVFVSLLLGCDGDQDANVATNKVWNVETNCGGQVDTDAFTGPINVLVWVKNSDDSECTVTVKEANRDVGDGINSGRIYHPDSHKIYTRVNIRAGRKLQIFCSGNDENKACKFDYGVQIL